MVQNSGLHIGTVGLIKRFHVYGFRCSASGGSGFRLKIGVSAVGSRYKRDGRRTQMIAMLLILSVPVFAKASPRQAGADPPCSDNADHLAFSLTPGTRSA
jgi:hypothetical protein